jgi:hypothetical protein
MAQCAGTTLKGERCKREAREGSAYCAIHFEKDSRAGFEEHVHPESGGPAAAVWTCDDTVKALLGIGIILAIAVFRFRR